MKTIKYLLMIAAVTTIAFTACTQDADSPTLPTPESDERPISFAASMPVKAWGVESKATGDPEWTLYYPLKELPYQEDGRRLYLSSTSSAQELTVTPVQNTTDTYTLTARYKYTYPNPEYNSETNSSVSQYLTEHRDLVWPMIEKTIDTDSDGYEDYADFYLTAKKDGVDYWAKATGHYEDDLTFSTLKPRKARFIIKLTVNGASFTLADNSFSFSLAGVKNAVDEETATNDDNIKTQAWPCSSVNWTNHWNIVLSGNTYTVTADDFAPQEVGNLTISHGSYSWVINLANVDVTGPNSSVKRANQWEAGDCITLNVSISYHELEDPSISVESFANGSSHEFDGVVQQP